MRHFVDYHIHSKYSRATSRECDLEHLSLHARQKGIGVVGSGDITHPAWRQELAAKLLPAEPGLYRLRPELEQAVGDQALTGGDAPTRFLLSGEISTIYKQDGRVRKIHHVILLSSLAAAERLAGRLERIGNIRSDGRPILGLDARSLLEILLETDADSLLIPAHIWTPWFSVLGAMSGFDSIEACYGDLAGHITAVETGLSSDPPMNWQVSRLDPFRLVSSSDAHSPERLGREVTVFNGALDYYGLRTALQTGEGYGGTLEFFPEEGKYFLDGHRECGIVWTPAECAHHKGQCPVCKRPVTNGVLNRVLALADRPAGERAPRAAPYWSVIPLKETLSEVLGVGVTSKRVGRLYAELLQQVGPELWLLLEAPLEEIARVGGARLAEGLARMRQGQVVRRPGYDGLFGVIRMFSES